MTVQWGVLSTARINDTFLAGVAGSATCDVLAVASRDADRAGEYAREHGIERAYGSYEALLADPDVDAVYISLPNALHLEWTRRALQAGKHVLCEKPLSRRASDVGGGVRPVARATRPGADGGVHTRHRPQRRRGGWSWWRPALGPPAD